MSQPRIVFLDGHTLFSNDLNPDDLNVCGHFIFHARTPQSQVLERGKDAEVLIVNKVHLGEEEFAALPNLKLVCVAATGYDGIDTIAARAHGVTVCHCEDYSTLSVAQLTLSLLLSLADGVDETFRSTRAGGWAACPDFCYSVRPRFELAGRKLCIVGMGNIGRAVAAVMKPLGLVLSAVTSCPQSELPEGVGKVTLEEAFATSDIVSLHCPLRADNRGMVSAELLAKTRPGLILLNTARGALVDETAVAEALHRGQLGAYCADVMSQEPPSAKNPLFTAPNAYITPHIGWATVEARRRVITQLIENIQSFFEGQPQRVVS